VSSGTLACIRKAISYWAIRVAISGSFCSAARKPLSRVISSTTCRCVLWQTPSGLPM
jgi:hypothetical protein